MKQKVKLLFFLLAVSSAVNAQLTDSLSLKENAFYSSLQNQVWESPLLYSNSQLKEYTFTQVDFSQKKLGLKRVQTAEKITDYNFSAEGIFNVKNNLRLFGDVLFNKSYENELGYNLSSERTEDQNVLSPNYFFAPKKGNWEHQKYNLNGGFSYQFQNNILLGANLFYKAHKSFRNIDPRPEIETSHYGGIISSGYRYKNHSVTAGGSFSQKTNTGSIIYVNDNQNAPIYTETFTRFSSGYGRIIFNNSYNSYIYKTFDKGFGFGYQYQAKKQSLSVNYSFNKSMENCYGKDANGNVYIDETLVRFKYRIINHKAKLDYWFDGATTDYKMGLNFDSQQGDNFSVAENGQNFRMSKDKIGFYTGLLKKENNLVLYSFEFETAYTEHQYIDLLGSTNKQLNTLDLKVSFNKDFNINAKNKLNLEIGIQHYSVLQEQLIIVSTTTDTSFLDNVVRPDHAFDLTSKLQPEVVLNHTVFLSKGKQLRVFVNAKTTTALDKKYQVYDSTLSIGHNQYLSAGIAIIY